MHTCTSTNTYTYTFTYTYACTHTHKCAHQHRQHMHMHRDIDSAWYKSTVRNTYLEAHETQATLHMHAGMKWNTTSGQGKEIWGFAMVGHSESKGSRHPVAWGSARLREAIIKIGPSSDYFPQPIITLTLDWKMTYPYGRLRFKTPHWSPTTTLLSTSYFLLRQHKGQVQKVIQRTHIK